MDSDDLLGLDVTEHGNFVLGRCFQRRRSQQPTGDLCKQLAKPLQGRGWIGKTHNVRKQAKSSQSMDGRLCGFRFLFSVHLGHEGNVDKCKVLRSNTELELSHCLDEGCRFDITDGSTELKQAISDYGMLRFAEEIPQ